MSDAPSRDSLESDSISGHVVMSQKHIVRKVIPEEEKFGVIHVSAYILSAVLGREYSGWNSTLSSGFGMFVIAQVLTAAACLGYYLCLCEIWSAIPFSGGSYGLSRASLGFFVGFLDGCCEALVYVAHSAISAMAVSRKIVLLFELSQKYVLVFCFVFYTISVLLTIQKSLVVLRRTYMVLALLSLLILLMYLFGVLKYCDFLKNAPLNNSPDIGATDNWFVGGMKQFMFNLPLSLTPYAGMKSFALLTIVTKEPKRTIPSAVVPTFFLIFAVNMFDIFVFVSQPGGILHTAVMGQPMMVGNALMFNLDPVQTFRATTLLSLPGSFSKLLTYILPAGNLFHCLGNSYYLPPFLCINKTQDRTNGCIVCGVFGMLLCVLIHYYPWIDLYQVCILATMITCCTFVYSYVMLRTTYSNVERLFVSPLGIPGAVFTFIFFALIGVASAFYQNSWFTLEFAAVCVGALTVYYFLIARKGDSLGEEEDKVFFQLHVRNYNMNRKKKRIKKAMTVGAKKGQVVPSDGIFSGEHSHSSLLSRLYHTSGESSVRKQTDAVSSNKTGPVIVEAFDEEEEMRVLQLGSTSVSDIMYRQSKTGEPVVDESTAEERGIMLPTLREDGEEKIELFLATTSSRAAGDLTVIEHHENEKADENEEKMVE